MKIFRLARFVALLFVLSGCSGSSDAPEGLLPEVASFLAAHPDFGHATEVQEQPDWAEGPRQGVVTDQGKTLLFYIKNGQVVTIYDNGPGERTKLWGDSSSSIKSVVPAAPAPLPPVQSPNQVKAVPVDSTPEAVPMLTKQQRDAGRTFGLND